MWQKPYLNEILNIAQIEMLSLSSEMRWLSPNATALPSRRATSWVRSAADFSADLASSRSLFASNAWVRLDRSGRESALIAPREGS